MAPRVALQEGLLVVRAVEVEVVGQHVLLRAGVDHPPAEGPVRSLIVVHRAAREGGAVGAPVTHLALVAVVRVLCKGQPAWPVLVCIYIY